MRLTRILLGLAILLLPEFMLVGCSPWQIPAAAPGSLDTSFNAPNGLVLFNSTANNKDRGVEVSVQADGKIVVLGYSHNGTNEDVFLARYNADGSLDTGFGNGGLVLYNGGGNDRGLGMALQQDGKIVAAGYTYIGSQRDVLVLRYMVNGTPDSTFGRSGAVTYSSVGTATDLGFGVAVQADGGIIVVGESSNGTNQDALVLRYTTAGLLDDRFATGGVFNLNGTGNGMDRGLAAAIQPDGKIIVVGSSVVNTKDDVLVFRLKSNGTLDETFGFRGVEMFSGLGDNFDYGNWVSLQADGKIVVCGATSNGRDFDLLLLRYNANGTRDSNFGVGGVATYGGKGAGNDYGYAHIIQPDGKIVIAGYTHNGTNDDVLLMRFDPAGKPDTSFGMDGRITWNGSGNDMDYGQGIALQTDGKLVLTGFSYNGANEDMLLMRFMP